MRPKLILSLVCTMCLLAVWLLGRIYQELHDAYEQATTLTELEYSWLFRLLLNLVGYATVLLPAFVLYKYLDKSNYFDKISNQSTCLYRVLYTCFGDPERDRLPETVVAEDADESGGEGGGGGGAKARRAGGGAELRRDAAELLLCFTGLMGAFLVWGLLQEKIMTQKYTLSDGSVVRFTESQVLVFTNRLAGLALAGGRLWAAGRPLPAPLADYSYCALSNVLSAWCQYEALKYLSFPTQVLSKSCKVLPVMAMGVLVSRLRYQPYEYVTAALISAGMALFLVATRQPAPAGPAAGGPAPGGPASWGLEWGGAWLLALYLASDSFTAQWQGALFRRRRPSALQMLCAVNVCACALTAPALRLGALRPLAHCPALLADVALLSVSSALGQLLIYRTIARFGAVVFTIIMTLRQAVSILVSCAVFGHAVPARGAAGVGLVLAAVLLRAYCSHSHRARARARSRSRARARPG